MPGADHLLHTPASPHNAGQTATGTPETTLGGVLAHAVHRTRYKLVFRVWRIRGTCTGPGRAPSNRYRPLPFWAGLCDFLARPRRRGMGLRHGPGSPVAGNRHRLGWAGRWVAARPVAAMIRVLRSWVWRLKGAYNQNWGGTIHASNCN